MPPDVTFVALLGSVRGRSVNRLLLDAAIDLAPPGVAVEAFDITRLPFYDADRDPDAGGDAAVPAVGELKRAIARCSGLMFATPEYNWSVPGVLKNAIDWASRPAGRSVLAGKPAAIMGAAPGPAGTGRAQLHLREILLSTRTPVLLRAVQVGHAGSRFDADGRLADEGVRRELVALWSELTGRAADPLAA